MGEEEEAGAGSAISTFLSPRDSSLQLEIKTAARLSLLICFMILLIGCFISRQINTLDFSFFLFFLASLKHFFCFFRDSWRERWER